MDNMLKFVKLWLSFAGGVLVLAVLYWAQAVLVPFALAILLTFVLAPPVTWLQRWVGRVPAVLVVVTLVFAALGVAGWGLTRQMDYLVEDLPGYRANIRTKIADVRLAGKGSAVEKLQETLEGIQKDLGTEAPKGTVSRPVVVTSNPATGFSAFAWLGPLVGPLSTAALVAAMVIFMLLERRDLRDRLIGLIGHGQLATTTKAIDEAGSRVSRQLLMQSLVSLLYGIAVFVGLYLPPRPVPIGLGDAGGGVAIHPVRRSRARGRRADPRQSRGAGGVDGAIDRPRFVRRPRAVHESRARNDAVCRRSRRVAGGAARVGRVLDVALGATRVADGLAADRVPRRARQARTRPRVRRVADGRHASARTGYGFYQRLVARDQSEAAELIDSHLETAPPASVYDALLLPALSYAERDRLEHRLSSEEETAVIEATRELIADAAETIRRQAEAAPPAAAEPSLLGPREPLRVLGYAVNGAADEVALEMLAHLIDDLPIAMEITAMRMQAVELAALVRDRKFAVVCFSDLPPSSASKTRYLVRRLRSALPELRIAVGRWGPPALADERPQALVDAGANHVASLLTESRTYLGGLLELPRLPVVDTATAVSHTASPAFHGSRVGLNRIRTPAATSR